jgi:hypothetical protein
MQQQLQQQQAAWGSAGSVAGQVQSCALLVALMCGVALRQMQRSR